jgi:hypothetical protein
MHYLEVFHQLLRTGPIHSPRSNRTAGKDPVTCGSTDLDSRTCGTGNRRTKAITVSR